MMTCRWWKEHNEQVHTYIDIYLLYLTTGVASIFAAVRDPESTLSKKSVSSPILLLIQWSQVSITLWQWYCLRADIVFALWHYLRGYHNQWVNFPLFPHKLAWTINVKWLSGGGSAPENPIKNGLLIQQTWVWLVEIPLVNQPGVGISVQALWKVQALLYCQLRILMVAFIPPFPWQRQVQLQQPQ